MLVTLKYDVMPSSQVDRPHGYLTMRENDIIVYNHECPPPPDDQEPGAMEYMQGTSTVAKVNRIVTNVALQRGFVVGWALLPLSKAKISHRTAGFRIISRTCSKMPPSKFFPPGVSRSLSEITVIPTRQQTEHPSLNMRPSASRALFKF
jgi:hypothetical protein